MMCERLVDERKGREVYVDVSIDDLVGVGFSDGDAVYGCGCVRHGCCFTLRCPYLSFGRCRKSRNANWCELITVRTSKNMDVARPLNTSLFLPTSLEYDEERLWNQMMEFVRNAG